MFLSRNMKNIRFFLSENVLFMEVKFFIYLNRRVFVMIWSVLYNGNSMAFRGLDWWAVLINSFLFHVFMYSRTPMAQTSLGPYKFVRDKSSSSHWGLIMVPGQQANGDNLGKPFRSSTQQWFVEFFHYNRLDEAIIMNTHNIQFYDKIRKYP